MFRGISRDCILKIPKFPLTYMVMQKTEFTDVLKNCWIYWYSCRVMCGWNTYYYCSFDQANQCSLLEDTTIGNQLFTLLLITHISVYNKQRMYNYDLNTCITYTPLTTFYQYLPQQLWSYYMYPCTLRQRHCVKISERVISNILAHSNIHKRSKTNSKKTSWFL